MGIVLGAEPSRKWRQRLAQPPLDCARGRKARRKHANDFCVSMQDIVLELILLSTSDSPNDVSLPEVRA